MRAPAFAPPCTAARRTAPDVRLAYLRQGRPDAHLAKALAEAGRRVEAVAIEDLVHQRFDAIIVDEAQDFRPEYWAGIELLLTSEADGYLYIFCDPNQALYSKALALPITDARTLHLLWAHN